MERWYNKWDVIDVSDEEDEMECSAPLDDLTSREDGVYAAVSQALGVMGPDFTVIGGSAIGASAAGDEIISQIIHHANLPSDKRPDFICHHLHSWNALLWIRWTSDDMPPFHDELYLCFPEFASKAAIPITETNKELFKVDILTKLCQLGSQRGTVPLLIQAFRLLSPRLEASFQLLSPYLTRRSAGKTSTTSPHRQVLAAYDSGLNALSDLLGESHPAVIRAKYELGATYEGHGSQQDLRLDGVAEAQECFHRCIKYFDELITMYKPGSSTDERVHAIKFKMAAIHMRIHQQRNIELAAAMYEELGEIELAASATQAASSWQ